VTLADRFEIKGLMSGSNGSVVLLDRRSGKQLLLMSGDALPENLGRLLAVADDEATFEVGQGDREETIRMAKRDLAYSESVPGRSDEPGESSPSEPDRLAERDGSSRIPTRTSPSPIPAAGSCPREAFVDGTCWSEDRSALRVRSPPVGDLEEGDRIIAVNGRRVKSIEELRDATPAGRAESTRITLVRGSRTVTIALEIGG
jgi:hypothetical protein